MRTLNIDTTTVLIAPLIPVNEHEGGEGCIKRRRERATVMAMLREHIGHEVTVDHNPDGSPYITGRDINLSISHSRDMAVVALDSQRRIGVDTETWRPQLERVRDKFLSPDEQRHWHTPMQLLTAWCIKEAAYKLAGISGLPLTDGIKLHEPEQHTVTITHTDRSIKLIYHIIEATDESATVICFPDTH